MIGLTGRTFGQYEIHERISHGGMAAVYRATQTSVQRTVAVKVLPPNFLEDRTFFDRFMDEVKIIAHLQHPKILPLYDFGRHEEMPYIVMAYLSGGTLENHIRQGTMPIAEIVDFVDQIADGLDYAHSKGVIHRDFKPSNVLLDGHGNVYLADFGIAKIDETNAQITGSTIVGTPAFMAPEVFAQSRLTKAVDIYALGVTMFQMLAGRQPYAARSLLQLMNAHVHEPVPDVRKTRLELPPAVQTVIERAMAKSPTARYNSAGELARAFKIALRDSTQPAPVVETQESQQKTQPIPEEMFDNSTVELSLPLEQTEQRKDAPRAERVERVEYIDTRRSAIGRLLLKPVALVGLLLSIVVILAAGIFGSFLLQTGNPLSLDGVREAAFQFGELLTNIFMIAIAN